MEKKEGVIFPRASVNKVTVPTKTAIQMAITQTWFVPGLLHLMQQDLVCVIARGFGQPELPIWLLLPKPAGPRSTMDGLQGMALSCGDPGPAAKSTYGCVAGKVPLRWLSVMVLQYG